MGLPSNLFSVEGDRRFYVSRWGAPHRPSNKNSWPEAEKTNVITNTASTATFYMYAYEIPCYDSQKLQVYKSGELNIADVSILYRGK